MDHNQTNEAVFNMAMLPNFLFLLAMIILLAALWYLLEHQK